MEHKIMYNIKRQPDCGACMREYEDITNLYTRRLVLHVGRMRLAINPLLVIGWCVGNFENRELTR